MAFVKRNGGRGYCFSTDIAFLTGTVLELLCCYRYGVPKRNGGRGYCFSTDIAFLTGTVLISAALV
jgi:hypothetical protein